MNRRDFLKLAGLTGAATATSPFWLKPGVGEANVPLASTLYGQGEWIPTCCHMCGGTTGVLAQVVDGRLVRIKPNSDNPVGFTNISQDFFDNAKKEGAVMCPKGNAGIMALYDPERIRKPLRRTNPQKGINVDPKFKEISWDEAYTEIANRLKGLRQAGEAHKLLWFCEDHCFTHIQADFCDLYGTPNFSMHSNLCDTGRKAAFKIMLGDERPLIDPLHSRYIMLWGWNPLSATKWAHLPRIFTRALEQGAKFIAIDPHLSYTASKATEWVPLRPGTDGALALAMGHVIIKEDLHDKAFIDEWTVGFEEYKEYVQDKTPQWAEAITTVPAETIVRLAKELATTKPACVDVWSGTHHTNGVYAGWSIGLLAALIGQIDKPGTLMFPTKKGNEHQHIHAEKSKQPRFDGGKDKYPYFHKSGVYVESINRLVDEKGPYIPKMAMIVFQNLMMSVPGTSNVEAALKKLEFIVSVDTMMSETALMADIVIPGTVYLERYDLNNHWTTWPVLGLRQPVVKPLFGQPTEYEFFIELGRRMELRDSEQHDFFWNGPISGEKLEDKTTWYEEFLSKELINGAPKISLEELKKLPGATWVSKDGTKYDKFKSAVPPEKVKDALIDKGLLFSKKPDGSKDKQIGFLKNGAPTKGFMTPSGKIQFYAKEHIGKKDAQGQDVSPLPIYKDREWQPSSEYPLYLINWKEASQTHSRSQNNKFLAELKQTDTLRINTKTALKLGIKNGDTVWVESPHGKVKGVASLTEAIHPEVVGTQHGWGHWALGETAKGRGLHTGFLSATKADSLSGQSLNKEICVKITKA
ncbi:MAG TPA: molybdopterin-dependent oxidoreductase [Bdellovibrionota bacterium]|nr:molybdopterin-dependent oxidoreductase [Bdellovibrionota bacterium]